MSEIEEEEGSPEEGGGAGGCGAAAMQRYRGMSVRYMLQLMS